MTTIDSTTQWFGSGGTQAEAMDTWVIHTTEGGSWPGYNGGSIAPNETIMPIPGKGISVRRHYPENASSMALENRAGGVQTNRAGVNQSELVGTCVKGGPGYYWPGADDAVLGALADYKRPFLDKYRIPHAGPAFVAYPASYGQTAGRMTFAQWGVFRGICGHQHVPENDHGDPGAFPLARLVAMLGTPAKTPPPIPSPQPAPQPAGALHVITIDLSHVTAASTSWARAAGIAPLQRLLQIKADGLGGPGTRAALFTYQSAHGLKPDAVFGPTTASALLAGR